MTPVEYILDPRWETIGWAVKEGAGETVWMTHEEFRDYLGRLQQGPDKICMISHNALFDMSVLAWRYDYVPDMMIDTLGMARAWMGHKMRSLALASLARYLGIGAKGDTVHKVQGMGLAAIKQAGFYEEYAEYSKTDADLCWSIYRHMVDEGFPVAEIAVMDSVIRMAVQPRFQIDQTLMAQHLNDVIANKFALVQRVEALAEGDAKKMLMSNDKFAAQLEALGIDPPTKISPTTGQETYAFAKTDAEFVELEEHPNPDVQALVSARLGVKSTIEETRTQRYLSISNLTWPGNLQRLMPMALKYSGAHTHRLSGDWKLNCQNLGRGSKLRYALEAPDGHLVVAVDSSQIEARMAATFCGAETMRRAFANKEDVYSSFATSTFGYEVSKATHPVERFIGKTAILGLQYGLGWFKFQGTVATQSKSQVGKEVILSDDEATGVVNTYRGKYSEIPDMWRRLNAMLARMTDRNCYEEIGPITILHEKIRLPSGLFLHYHNLEYLDGQWWFTYAGKPKKIYGGKMLENIIQALARIVVMDAAVRVRRRLRLEGPDDITFSLQVHDELVFVCPEERAQWLLDLVTEEMRIPPSWMPNVPLDAEGSFGKTYGECK
jgi:hypothetical protein